jgi:SNF2 family DNA or RNA helicase
VARGIPAAYQDVLERQIEIPAAHAAAFLQRELPSLRRYFELADEALPDFELAEIKPKQTQCAFILELEGSLNYLAAKLKVEYSGNTITLARHPARTNVARDFAAEEAAVERLHNAGFTEPDAEGQMVLKGEQRTLAFFARELPRWEKTATVVIGSRFAHVTREIERIKPRLEIRSSGQNWFELQVELATPGGERFSAQEIQRLLQSGQTHIRNNKGKISVFDPEMLDELQQTLRDCEPRQRQPGVYQVDQAHASFLESMAAEQGAELSAPAPWRASVAAQRTLETLQPVALGSLETTLRPYQKHGVNWMYHLARNGFAGILADEMGLGKTVQALALLRALGGKALIVCPSSLVYNWQREAERFTPDRKVLVIEGPARQTAFGKPLAEADLVITSYALLRRDADHYRPTEFTTAILDEAQHIKNPETQNAQAAFGIRSRHRFVLTGTPVENSVRDLWSLMNFLMPGYLGNRNDFRDRYEKPINDDPSGPEHRRLTKRLRPFVLRRRKKEVITELPDKIEQVAYCELNESQRTIYAELVKSTKREMSDLAGAKDQNKARMLMLTAILRLRQACCDLRLLKLEDEKAAKEPSGKLEMLGELLGEALDDGHRVLIFSQFVGMLHILRDWLTEQGIAYCYLDGSTKNRGAEVDRFQEGPTPIFLISLKAGGVGLNLTAADTVVHFDPWWNPAVEAQATDRAHRIGQKKVVTAYKLITRGTIEEKILSLQAKKRQIIDATVESEEPMMQGLSAADLQELLE